MMSFDASAFGKTTETSMQSGILWGTAFMVDGMIDRISAETGWREICVIATGGLAGLLHRKSKRIRFVEPFLTLEGMRIIYDKMKGENKQGG